MSLDTTLQASLIAGARDTQPVSGLTHNFYRYPARFSPAFVRAAIEAFTSVGDTVLDPYMGGGTSLVEATALGRNAVGVDVNQLAEFVAEVKTTALSEADLTSITRWAKRVGECIDVRGAAVSFEEYEELGYFKHLGDATRWRIRRCIEQALRSALKLRESRRRSFARCAILRTAQWALDGRRSLPSVSDFRDTLRETILQMLEGARQYRERMENHEILPRVKIINRSASDLSAQSDFAGYDRPKLVVTSPPYPGVHVLYHRWQVDGRKETAAPFWIANKLDGSGSSYYTMGDRRSRTQDTYFARLLESTKAIVDCLAADAMIVQMVAFSRPARDLPRYLETMTAAGLEESFLDVLIDQGDGRLWRDVPNRRWYADQRGSTPSSQEVVLLHRVAKTASEMPSARPSQPSSAALGRAAR